MKLGLLMGVSSNEVTVWKLHVLKAKHCNSKDVEGGRIAHVSILSVYNAGNSGQRLGEKKSCEFVGCKMFKLVFYCCIKCVSCRAL